MEQSDLIGLDFGMDDMIVGHLKESGKWARFLGITGFIFCGLFALVAVFSAGGAASALFEVYGLGYMVLIIYLLLAIITFVFSLFVFRFGIYIKTALENSNQEKLLAAFGNLRLFFRTAGIMTILYIVFILLAFLGAFYSSGSR